MTDAKKSKRHIILLLLISTLTILINAQFNLYLYIVENPDLIITVSIPLILLLISTRFSENETYLSIMTLYISLLFSSAIFSLASYTRNISTFIRITLVLISCLTLSYLFTILFTRFWDHKLNLSFPIGFLLKQSSSILYSRRKPQLFSLLVGFLFSFILSPISFIYKLSILGESLPLGLMIAQAFVLSFSSYSFLLTSIITLGSFLLMSTIFHNSTSFISPFSLTQGFIVGCSSIIFIEAILHWYREGRTIPERSSLIQFLVIGSISFISLLFSITEVWTMSFSLNVVTLLLSFLCLTIISSIFLRLGVEMYPLWRWHLPSYRIVWNLIRALITAFKHYSLPWHVLLSIEFLTPLICEALPNASFIIQGNVKIILIISSYSCILSSVLLFSKLLGYTLLYSNVLHMPSLFEINVNLNIGYVLGIIIPLIIFIARFWFPFIPINFFALVISSFLPTSMLIPLLVALIFRFLLNKLKDEDKRVIYSFIIGMLCSWSISWYTLQFIISSRE